MPKRHAALALALALFPLAAASEDRFSAEIRSVEAIRGRAFTSPVEHRTLSRTKLREFLKAQIERDLPRGSKGYLEALEALFLVDGSAGVDSLLDLYDAQVLAFYDPAEHVYYAIDQPPKGIPMPPPMVEAIQVHELMHALQDQAFDAGRKTIELQPDWDAALAYQSLLEGEATLVMLAHLGRMMGIDLETMVAREEMVDALRDAAARGDTIPAGVPRYFVDSLQFPYVDGLAFALDVYRRGGWKALDAVHENPPVSTEEVLRPELYRARVASQPKRALPRVQAPGEGEILRTVLGEFHWTFLLGRKAGEGWGSDRVVVRSGAHGVTVLVDTSWDTAGDAREFAEALAPLLEKKNARGRKLELDGARVRAGWGSDAAAIREFVAGTDRGGAGVAPGR